MPIFACSELTMLDNAYIKQRLVAIALNNDQVAYKELFVFLYDRLKQFTYSILKSNEEAEELVSDLFIKLWQKREQLTEIETPLFYFYTAAKNLAITRLSKEKKRQSLSIDDWLMQPQSISFDPERLMLTAEITRQINSAIQSLPPRCGLIFKLIKEDGLKYREVAELLQVSIKTVEAQMAIALRRLAQCMQMEVKTPAKTLIYKKTL